MIIEDTKRGDGKFKPFTIHVTKQAEAMLLAKLFGATCTDDCLSITGEALDTFNDYLALKSNAGRSNYEHCRGFDIEVSPETF